MSKRIHQEFRELTKFLSPLAPLLFLLSKPNLVIIVVTSINADGIGYCCRSLTIACS
jgi:hypothetical protein